MTDQIIRAPRQAGIYVRRQRERRSLTRAQLALKSGVSERLIASLELGDATGIRLDKLMAIFDALDLSLAVQHKEADSIRPLTVQPSDSGHQSPTSSKSSSDLPSYEDLYHGFAVRQGIIMHAPKDDDDGVSGEANAEVAE